MKKGSGSNIKVIFFGVMNLALFAVMGFGMILQNDKIDAVQEDLTTSKKDFKKLYDKLELLNEYKAETASTGTNEIPMAVIPNMKTGKLMKAKSLKMAEGFYCHSDGEDFLVMSFESGGSFNLRKIAIKNAGGFSKGIKPVLEGTYLLVGNGIYVSYKEERTKLNKKFEVLNFDDRGYVLQVDIHTKQSFTISGCPAKFQEQF